MKVFNEIDELSLVGKHNVANSLAASIAGKLLKSAMKASDIH
jgi:UDP-N-acetylmuramate-alanine ligase